MYQTIISLEEQALNTKQLENPYSQIIQDVEIPIPHIITIQIVLSKHRNIYY
jgi:hypothetical protein